MKQTKALRRTLEDMTEVYMDRLGAEVDVYDRDVPEVEFTSDTPHAAEDGSYVAVAPNVKEVYGKSVEGPNELRIVVDTLNHEVAHIKYSDLTGKKEFSEEYPQCPTLAGLVLNVLEDQYIDWQRLKAFRGLRRSHSFKVDKIMANGHRRPPLTNLSDSEALGEGFLQMAFSGYVKGYSDASDEVREAIAKCRPLVDEVRNCHDEGEREEIAHAVMDILLEAMPDPDEAEEYADEGEGDMPTDEAPDLTDEEIEDLLEDMDPEDLEQDGDGQTIEIPDSVDVPEWLEDEMDEQEGAGGEQGDEGEEQDEPGDESGEGGDGGDDPQGEEPEDGDAGGQPAGEETEGSSQEQGGSPGSDGGEHESDADHEDADTTAGGASQDLDDVMDELDKREREREAGEHWNAGDSDYEQADEDMQQRYDTIRRQTQQEQTELGQQKRRREEKLEQGRDASDYMVEDSPEQIRERLRNDGLAEEIVEAFKQFKTNDRWVPKRQGERLNTRNAVRRLSGDYTEDKVYEEKRKAEVGDRCVGVALDLSGSMSDMYDNLTEVKMALGALHLATKTIGDDLLATGFKTLKEHPSKESTEPVLDLVTGPSEGFQWEHLDGARAGYYTPTPDGVMYTLSLLKKSHRREKVMLVVTDGKANIPLGGSHQTDSSQGREDAARAVSTARQEGVKVIGLAVGSGVGEEYMQEVFGNSWAHAEMDDLADRLVDIYREQMRVDPGGR